MRNKSLSKIILISSVILVVIIFSQWRFILDFMGRIDLSITTDSQCIELKYSRFVSGVGKVIFWEKDSNNLLWAVSFAKSEHSDELRYGILPEPAISPGFGYKIPARQQYPTEGENADPLPMNKDVYVYIEFVVDSFVGPSLDSVMYIISGSADDEYFSVKKILPRSRLIPNEVEKLWEY